MAFNADAWVPVEIDPNRVTKDIRSSAIEKVATPVVMNSATKEVPVEGDFSIGAKTKGSSYTENSDTAEVVELKARVLGGFATIAKEDLQDSATSVVQERAAAGSGDLALYLDNAALGVTADISDTLSNNRPFVSVYRAVSQYSAGINLIQTAGALTYADLTSLFAKVTVSRFFSMGDAVILADDSLMWSIMNIVGTDGHPIYNANAGLSGLNGQLFGVDVVWTKGARTSAAATNNPEGNPILVLTTKRNLLRGDAKLDGAKTTLPGFKVLTEGDDAFEKEIVKVKVSVRRGFRLAVPAAAGVIEITG